MSRSQQLSLCRVEYVELIPVYRRRVDGFILWGTEFSQKAEYRLAGAKGPEIFLHFPFILMNRLNETDRVCCC